MNITKFGSYHIVVLNHGSFFSLDFEYAIEITSLNTTNWMNAIPAIKNRGPIITNKVSINIMKMPVIIRRSSFLKLIRTWRGELTIFFRPCETVLPLFVGVALASRSVSDIEKARMCDGRFFILKEILLLNICRDQF